MNRQLIDNIVTKLNSIDKLYERIVENSRLKLFPFFKSGNIKFNKSDKFKEVLDKVDNKLDRLARDVEKNIHFYDSIGNTDFKKREENRWAKVRKAGDILDILKSEKLPVNENNSENFINFIDIDEKDYNNITYISHAEVLSAITKKLISIQKYNTEGATNSQDILFIYIIHIISSYLNNDKVKFLNKFLNELEPSDQFNRYLNKSLLEKFKNSLHTGLINVLTEESYIGTKSKKINKAITDICKSTENSFEKKDIEFLGSLIKETISEENNKNQAYIREIKGNLINYYYTIDNYDLTTKEGDEAYGSLGASCMRYPNKSHEIDFYSENTKSISMLVKISKTDFRKIRARSIIWTDIHGNKYSDRIYSATDEDYIDLQNYIKRKDYANLYRGSNLPVNDEPVIIIVNETKHTPYLDSLINILRVVYKNEPNNVYNILLNKNFIGELIDDEKSEVRKEIESIIKQVKYAYSDSHGGLENIIRNIKGNDIKNDFDCINELMKEKCHNKSRQEISKNSSCSPLSINPIIAFKDIKKRYAYTERIDLKEQGIVFYDPINNKIPSVKSSKVLFSLKELDKLDKKIRSNIIRSILFNNIKSTNNNKLSDVLYFFINKEDIKNNKDIVYSKSYEEYLYTPSFIEYNGKYVDKDNLEEQKLLDSEEWKDLINKTNKNHYFKIDDLRNFQNDENCYANISRLVNLIGFQEKIMLDKKKSIAGLLHGFKKDSETMYAFTHPVEKKVKNIKREGKYIKVATYIIDNLNIDIYYNLYKLENSGILRKKSNNKIKLWNKHKAAA